MAIIVLRVDVTANVSTFIVNQIFILVLGHGYLVNSVLSL
jgi:hypothetical protein